MTTAYGRTIVIVNFKRIKGQAAIDLAGKLNTSEDRLAEKYDIILAVQPPDAIRLCSLYKFNVVIQDTFSDDGDLFLNFFRNISNVDHRIIGVLLNHPEIRCPRDRLMEYTRRAVDLDIGTIVCATTIDEACEIDLLAPRYIGLENESLIGKDISFCDYCPDMIVRAKERISNPILIGAGIRNHRDIQHVVDSGGAGVLLSSVILKSADPAIALNNLLC